MAGDTMTDETKAKLLDLSGNQAVADAIDAHVRAVVEEMLQEKRLHPDAEVNRILLSRVSGALVNAGTVEVEPYDQAIRALTAERDEAMAGWRAATAAWDSDAQDSRVERGRLAARVAELEASEAKAWKQYEAMARQTEALQVEAASLRARPVWCRQCEGSGRMIVSVGGQRTAGDWPCPACAGIGKRIETTEANVADTGPAMNEEEKA